MGFPGVTVGVGVDVVDGAEGPRPEPPHEKEVAPTTATRAAILSRFTGEIVTYGPVSRRLGKPFGPGCTLPALMASLRQESSSAWGRRAKKASEFLFYSVLRFVRGLFGLTTALSTPDRRVLDGIILPPLVKDPSFRTVVFIGCDWYTQHYESMFSGRDYWTMEVDPARARFGAAQHLIAPMSEIASRFVPGSVDLVICNGVIGWGLNDPSDIDASLSACAKALRLGGVLVLGWNDIPEKRPVALDSLPSLGAFRRFHLGGQTEFQTETYNRHTFSLYERADQVREPSTPSD